MTMKVAGKVALITGGTGGLGKAFAKALLNGNAAAVSGLNRHISPLLHTIIQEISTLTVQSLLWAQSQTMWLFHEL